MDAHCEKPTWLLEEMLDRKSFQWLLKCSLFSHDCMQVSWFIVSVSVVMKWVSLAKMKIMISFFWLPSQSSSSLGFILRKSYHLSFLFNRAAVFFLFLCWKTLGEGSLRASLVFQNTMLYHDSLDDLTVRKTLLPKINDTGLVKLSKLATEWQRNFTFY